MRGIRDFKGGARRKNVGNHWPKPLLVTFTSWFHLFFPGCCSISASLLCSLYATFCNVYINIYCKTSLSLWKEY